MDKYSLDLFLQFFQDNYQLLCAICTFILSCVALVTGLRNKKTLSSTEVQKSLKDIHESIPVIASGLSVLLAQKKGNLENENESLKESGKENENENLKG